MKPNWTKRKGTPEFYNWMEENPHLRVGDEWVVYEPEDTPTEEFKFPTTYKNPRLWTGAEAAGLLVGTILIATTVVAFLVTS